RTTGRCPRQSLLLLLVLFVDNLGVDDIVLGAGAGIGACPVTGGGTLGALLVVDGFADLLLLGAELAVGGLRCIVVFARECFLDSVDIALHLGLALFGQLVVVVGQQLLGLVGEVLRIVADSGGLTAPLVLFCVLLGLTDHALDVFLRQCRTAGDR